MGAIDNSCKQLKLQPIDAFKTKVFLALANVLWLLLCIRWFNYSRHLLSVSVSWWSVPLVAGKASVPKFLVWRWLPCEMQAPKMSASNVCIRKFWIQNGFNWLIGCFLLIFFNISAFAWVKCTVKSMCWRRSLEFKFMCSLDRVYTPSHLLLSWCQEWTNGLASQIMKDALEEIAKTPAGQIPDRHWVTFDGTLCIYRIFHDFNFDFVCARDCAICLD